MITPKDKIGYIRRTEDENGKETFKYMEAKITRINVGKTRTSVYSDKFYALDIEELEFNTRMMGGDIILVGEPFITNDSLGEHLREVVEYWNKHGARSILSKSFDIEEDE